MMKQTFVSMCKNKEFYCNCKQIILVPIQTNVRMIAMFFLWDLPNDGALESWRASIGGKMYFIKH